MTDIKDMITGNGAKHESVAKSIAIVTGLLLTLNSKTYYKINCDYPLKQSNLIKKMKIKLQKKT